MYPNHALRIRGGGPAKAAANAVDPAAKFKKVRIAAFDSMRAALILNIVLGHFVAFANPSPMMLRLLSQHNVVVGAFFALSGYVIAYTSSENASKVPSAKLMEVPKQKWILQKIFGYYPMHLAVLALFSPLFLYADVSYNGWIKTAWHGFLSVTMTQAWFPMHAEVWNAPTWYLSSLAVCTAVMPFALPSLSTMSKPQLRRTGLWVWLLYMLPKIGYAYDFGAWNLMEGITAPKAHPNLAVFNMQRFNPLFAVAEFLLGAIACRLVMLDGAEDEEAPPKTNLWSTIVPTVLLKGAMLSRGLGYYSGSDLLVRAVVFVPLFLRLLMACHRNTVGKVSDPLLRLLNSAPLVALGNLSFPIFIVHGPVGQIFFKKLIATKMFGQVLRGPGYFGLYLTVTFASAVALQKLVMQNKAVDDWSKTQVEKLSKWV